MNPFVKKVFTGVVAFCLCAAANAETVLRIGHFPNISHAQALVAHRMSMLGKGWFEERLGKDVKIQWQLFNAGPSAMESLFAGAVDITYVGPNPAINAYAKTRGRDIRILAGSADGGASLIVKPEDAIKTAADFKGKKIGTPQLGNTQDVACRAWLIDNGLKITMTSGDALIIPTPNPEQLMLFKRGELDAVWTVEPWATRLQLDGGGKIFLEQKDAVTTILVTNNKTLKKHAELVKKFVAAHKELTDWINKNPEEAQKLALEALDALMGGTSISKELVKASWPRLTFTAQVNHAELEKFVDGAHKCGFLRRKLDIKNIFADTEK